MNAIEVHNLHKSYGSVRAVDGIDLSLASGEFFALLGPNGAGETTIVEILEGFRAADSEEVTVLNFDPQVKGVNAREFRDRIGIVLQSTADAGDLTVRELWSGQRRRLEVTLGIVGTQELLFLDEPTTGFDPEARHSFWELIRNFTWDLS